MNYIFGEKNLVHSYDKFGCMYYRLNPYCILKDCVVFNKKCSNKTAPIGVFFRYNFLISALRLQEKPCIKFSIVLT